jgi:putative phosphoribosyl transferase
VSLQVADSVRVATPTFFDRREAGRVLVDFMSKGPDPDALVLALPRGGIPVARPLADRLDAELRPLLVRKLPIPDSPEMGFGAVTLDGTVVLNEPVIRRFGIDDASLREVIDETFAEVRRRAAVYPGGDPLPGMAGRTVYLVDDGLATGFTALAAARMLAAQGPAKVVLAVPVSSARTLRLLEPEVDDVFCLIEQSHPPFAVASFYSRFPDLDDEEVVRILLGA